MEKSAALKCMRPIENKKCIRLSERKAMVELWFQIK